MAKNAVNVQNKVLQRTMWWKGKLNLWNAQVLQLTNNIEQNVASKRIIQLTISCTPHKSKQICRWSRRRNEEYTCNEKFVLMTHVGAKVKHGEGLS